MHISEETPIVIEPRQRVTRATTPESPVWRTFTLGVIPRLGLPLGPATVTVFPATRIQAGDVCLLTLGPTRRLREGERLPFEVRWRADTQAGGASANARNMTLYRDCVTEVSASEPWTQYRFSLERVAGTSGSILVECARGWFFWRKQELVLYDLVVSDEPSLDLERARSFRSTRIRNEQANFDAYYQHAAFQPNATTPAVSEAVCATTPSASEGGPELSTTPSERPPVAEANAISPPQRAITAVEYSHSQLAKRMGLAPPAFGWQLQTKVRAFKASRKPGDTSKFRVLSLCSGAARIESDLVRGIPADALSLTLVDVNPNLLDLARGALAYWGDVETIVADVNALDLRGERYDIILCVSALHHLVELEHVISEVARAIADTGEFWSIGETLGRNGARMWPESYAVANTYFRSLDPRYRLSRITGTVDESLPDLDYSIGCFEGIRAESIEPALLRFLSPREVSKHNCIIGRLFSPTYSDNFDIALDEDRALVDKAIELDIALHGRGPYGVELHGIYGPAERGVT